MPAIITPTAGISGSLSPAGALHGEIIRRDVERHGTYDGPLSFEPSDDEQIISAANLIVPEDIAIRAIPAYRPDVRDTTAEAGDVAAGKAFYGADGLRIVGDQKVPEPSYILLASEEHEYSMMSTTQTTAWIFNCPADDVWRSDKMIYVKLRDKAGMRAGYFFGSDSFVANYTPAAGDTTKISNAVSFCYYDTNGVLYSYRNAQNSYGVFVTSINKSGGIIFGARYSSVYSKQIDGTYVVEVYALDWPGGISPFVA